MFALLGKLLLALVMLVLAYLLGSIPSGLLITRLAGMGDIRTIGSGNIGATNVMRTGNKKLGILTLLLDASKGAVAVGMVSLFLHKDETGHFLLSMLALYVVVLGHIFPIWLQFRGGKGVATALGAMTAYYWPLGIIFAVTWLAVFYAKKFVSLASLAAMGAVTLAPVLMFANIQSIWLFLPLFALTAYTHRENIERLRAGTEHSFRKSAK
jgi:glycerol-3-phosphate acyltransferase PlsY